MSDVICPNCQRVNRLGAKFCGGCGRSLSQVLTPGPSPIPAPPTSGPVHSLTGNLPPHFMLNSRYLVLQKLGQGGMGAVYQVMDTLNQNRILAVKEMSDSALKDPEEKKRAVQMFEQEAHLLQKLKHPNLPFVTDRFAIQDRHYLVMEYVRGRTLGQMLEERTIPFTESEVLNWGHQLCDVLHYLHSQSPPIIFRDMKPDNIMITPESQVKLIDFGIVRFFKSGQAKDTMLLGTPGFAPPEQHGTGQTDERSDVYALGVTLHCLLTLREPEILRQPLPIRELNPHVSQQLEKALLGATKEDPRQRFKTTDELKAALPIPSGSGYLATGVTNPSAHSGLKTSRLTTRLVLQTARLSTRQLLGLGATILILFVVGAWLLTPVIRNTFLWHTPLISFVGPFAFTAVRRKGAAAGLHIPVAILGGLLTWSRGNVDNGNVGGLIAGAILSGLAVELMYLFLPKLVGYRGREEPGVWQLEIILSALTAIPNYILLTGLSFAFDLVFASFSWAISGMILAAIGWFVGDIIHSYLLIRRLGLTNKP